MIPALDSTTGLLPVGRYSCTEVEVENRFVSGPEFAASVRRKDVWDDWQQARIVLQGAVTVHAAWLGGSFTTSKIDPDDIDVTFVVNAQDFASRTLADQRIVSLFNTAGMVKTQLGLKVDSYVMPWECIPVPVPPNPATGITDSYFWARGYWDDWWQRHQANKGSAPNPVDAVPRRGYLEVLLSDYP